MLEQQDYEQLGGMIQTIVAGTLEQKLDEKLDEKLDQKLLVFKKEFTKELKEGLKIELREELNKDLSKTLGEQVDDSITRNNEIIFKRIDDSIARSESFLLDEIDRFYTLTKDRLDRLEKKVDEITVYYQSQRSHDDACETLFHLYYQQQEEIDQIKERLALTS